MLERAPGEGARFWLAPAHTLSLPLLVHPHTLVVVHAHEPWIPQDPAALISYGLIQAAMETSAPGILEPFAWPSPGTTLPREVLLEHIRWGHAEDPALLARLQRGFVPVRWEPERLWLVWDHRAIGGRVMQETKKEPHT